MRSRNSGYARKLIQDFDARKQHTNETIHTALVLVETRVQYYVRISATRPMIFLKKAGTKFLGGDCCWNFGLGAYDS